LAIRIITVLIRKEL